MKIPVRSTLPFQVPAFVAEEKPVFMDFLDAYYEFLEQDGYSIDYIRNALTFLDVDQTLDRFVNFFWDEVKEIPLDAKANRRLLAKHIYDLYQSKGTIKSYKLLFRILYNEDIDIYTPKVDMLRVSDGKWEVDSVMRVTASSGDPFGLIGLTLRQNLPDASMLVQNVIKKTYGSTDYYDVYIEPLSVVGTFRYNETAYAHWTDTSGNQQTIVVNLPPAPALSDIRVAGSYYTAGEDVLLYDSTGQNFLARISEIGLGRIDDVLILDGGSGYSVGNSLSVDNTNTGGANLKVVVAAVDGGVITKLNIVNPGVAYSDLPVVTGAHGGKFLPISTSIGRVLDVVTADLGVNHPVQDAETTSRTRGIITDPIGSFLSGESLTLLSEGILTENYFSLLNEDGTRILDEQQVSQTTSATVYSIVNNTILLDGQVSRRAIEIEGEANIILTEDGGALINEMSSAVLNRRTIQGVTSGAICRIIDMNPASILFEPGTLAVTSKKFTNLDGKVSEATKRIQDSKFYQDFSYVIKSAQSIDTYKNIVQRLLHPAGLAMFGQVNSNTFVQIGLRVIQQFENIVNIETFLQTGLEPEGSDTRLTFPSIFSNPLYRNYSSFDKWKFDNVRSNVDSPYQSDTLIANFSNVPLNNVYIYFDGNAVDYVQFNNFLTRGSEIRVNGILI
jgi:hypothetical protein